MPVEPTLEPYNGYDPEQNELLLIEPSLKHPILTLERVEAFLGTLESRLDDSKDWVRILHAMRQDEYLTCNNYFCMNPIEIKESIKAIQRPPVVIPHPAPEADQAKPARKKARRAVPA